MNDKMYEIMKEGMPNKEVNEKEQVPDPEDRFALIYTDLLNKINVINPNDDTVSEVHSLFIDAYKILETPEIEEKFRKDMAPRLDQLATQFEYVKKLKETWRKLEKAYNQNQNTESLYKEFVELLNTAHLNEVPESVVHYYEQNTRDLLGSIRQRRQGS